MAHLQTYAFLRKEKRHAEADLIHEKLEEYVDKQIKTYEPGLRLN